MKSKDFPDCFYRVSVKGLCVRDDKLLLVKESSKLSGQWELPGGGLEFGEDIRAGLEREIEEETGLNVISIAPGPTYVWTNRREKKRGLDWFYSLVLAYQIDLEHTNLTPTTEAEEVKFFNKEDLQTLDLHAQSIPLRELFDPKDFS